MDKSWEFKISPQAKLNLNLKQISGEKAKKNKKESERKGTDYSLGKCLDLDSNDLPELPVKESRANNMLKDYLTRNSKASDTLGSDRQSMEQAGENKSQFYTPNYVQSLSEEVHLLESKKKALLCDVITLEKKIKELKDEKEVLEMEKVQEYYAQMHMRDHDVFL